MPCERARRAARTCEVIEDGARCTSPHYGKEMCRKHNQRWRKHGSPLHLNRGAHIVFIRKAAWTETDDCIVPPWYDGTRPVVKVDGVRRAASRQAWIERHGDPGGRAVLHSCSGGSGDLGCINVRHFYLGDEARNNLDRQEAGCTVLPEVRGEAHGQAKLTVRDVRQIRALAADGLPHAVIAERFPVSRRTVTKIVGRQAWAWLDAPEGEALTG
ncbi:hypothetical protein [Streptomyces afghaniensis]|uniref:hypothetical protein n=1 Tax=Streptomyces afghaniensis TaxID=66865 RepID=UPI0027839C7E|nr:hypothetical protein [Streptomyces afghaniensis]MDQ1018972.1 hypothetical protein [Streptomyces afghaniensis]